MHRDFFCPRCHEEVDGGYTDLTYRCGVLVKIVLNGDGSQHVCEDLRGYPAWHQHWEAVLAEHGVTNG